MLPTNLIAYIYNPLNLSEEEIRKNFVVRSNEFNKIFSDLKNSPMIHPESPYIIQGQRGQGKTMLLLKLYYEIKHDEALNTFLIPIIFNEEQYHINNLFGLWVDTAEKLEEADTTFAGLSQKMETFTEDEEVKSFALLEKTLKTQQKKLLLLIDNIDQLLDKLTINEQHRLRELLITCPEFRIIGGSSKTLEYNYDYSGPFYELFQVVTLEGLKREEAIRLLLMLGEQYGREGIQDIIQRQPGRIEALRRMTSGVPRTMVLLFEIFLEQKDGGAFRDLEIILDRVTPLYKHRMDDLSPPQQQIVDAIAIHWDAMATKEIAEKTRMQSKAVSAQLKLLEKNQVIQKIDTSTKNFLYQVKERFFNIWYLMRYGRKQGKNRVQWLVRFIESWCDEAELQRRTKEHITNLQNDAFNQLRNNELEKAISIGNNLFINKKYGEKSEPSMVWVEDYFILLLAKKQYYAALKMFNESPLNLKERFKPIYYALMSFLKADFPDEFKKMGPELAETVDEVIAKIKQWEIDYA